MKNIMTELFGGRLIVLGKANHYFRGDVLNSDARLQYALGSNGALILYPLATALDEVGAALRTQGGGNILLLKKTKVSEMHVRCTGITKELGFANREAVKRTVSVLWPDAHFFMDIHFEEPSEEDFAWARKKLEDKLVLQNA